MYSEQVLDHFQNPRHVGDLEDADALAEVQNPACGDVMRLSLKVRDGKIVGVRYKAQGCVPSIACGSKLAELLNGLSLKDAALLAREDLIAGLGGLPEASEHAGYLAIDALKQALKKVPR